MVQASFWLVHALPPCRSDTATSGLPLRLTVGHVSSLGRYHAVPLFFYPLDTWGKNVAAASPPSWEIYVKSRLSCPPPLSPYGLLQEVYAPDTWKLLVACVLMSRVSSAETKHRCLSAFFDSYPVRAFSRVFVLRVSAPRSLMPCCWRFPE